MGRFGQPPRPAARQCGPWSCRRAKSSVVAGIGSSERHQQATGLPLRHIGRLHRPLRRHDPRRWTTHLRPLLVPPGGKCHGCRRRSRTGGADRLHATVRLRASGRQDRSLAIGRSRPSAMFSTCCRSRSSRWRGTGPWPWRSYSWSALEGRFVLRRGTPCSRSPGRMSGAVGFSP